MYSNINHKHSEYIENVDLQTKLTGVVKECSEYSIENKAIEILTEVSNIKNSVDTNLQNVAKESEPKIIENKIIELENRLNSFIEKDNKGKFYFNKETIDNAIKLVKYLMKKYNIPIENVLY